MSYIKQCPSRLKKFIKRDDATEWIMIWLTLAIVGFTGVSVYFTCNQISIYKEATRTDLRAYVVVDSFMVYLAPEQKVVLSWYMRNFGKTPALNVRQLTLSRYTPITNSEFANGHPAISDSGIVIAPDRGFKKIVEGGIISRKDFDELVKTKNRLYFAVILEYRDVFYRDCRTEYYISQGAGESFTEYMPTHNIIK